MSGLLCGENWRIEIPNCLEEFNSASRLTQRWAFKSRSKGASNDDMAFSVRSGVKRTDMVREAGSSRCCSPGVEAGVIFWKREGNAE
jgi:hypothetical protein